MRILYTTLLYCLMPLVLLRMLVRGIKAPGYLRRWNERFGFFCAPQQQGVIWVHAVSVGEFQAALPLIFALRKRYPQRGLVVTTTTPTGSQRVQDALQGQVFHVYAPYDLPGALKRFLSRVQPELVVIMETELWPNLFHICQQRALPLVVANARLSERSFAGYRKVRSLAASTLAQCRLIAAQSEADGERYRRLGADRGRVKVLGNLKFDLRVPSSVAIEGADLRRALGDERPVLIAASTHSGEDECVLEAFERLRLELPHVVLILAPRHPERFKSVAGLCRRAGWRVIQRTTGAPSHDCDILLADTMGELLRLYAAADVAFVGGSLVPVGGHNVLEPAALGIPVIFGPHMFNFTEASRQLQDCGAGWRVDNAAGLAQAAGLLLNDKALRDRAGQAARQALERNRGTLERLMCELDGLLPEVSAHPDSPQGQIEERGSCAIE